MRARPTIAAMKFFMVSKPPHMRGLAAHRRYTQGRIYGLTMRRLPRRWRKAGPRRGRASQEFDRALNPRPLRRRRKSETGGEDGEEAQHRVAARARRAQRGRHVMGVQRRYATDRTGLHPGALTLCGAPVRWRPEGGNGHDTNEVTDHCWTFGLRCRIAGSRPG